MYRFRLDRGGVISILGFIDRNLESDGALVGRNEMISFKIRRKHTPFLSQNIRWCSTEGCQAVDFFHSPGFGPVASGKVGFFILTIWNVL